MKTKTLMPLGLRGFAIAVATIALFASFVMLAYADVVPTVSVAVKNTSNATVTSANIGSTVFATALVASTSATTSPSGTVTFNRYDNTSCVGTPTIQSGVSLVNGAATSSNATVGASGLSYKVLYSGGGIFSNAESACMPVAATASSTSISTTLSTTSVLAGSTVHESATLIGATANASGTVAYNVYTNNSCTTSLVGAGVRTVTNATVPNSDSLLFNNAGTFYWRAVYSGDANNAAATSSCLALTVLATSTPTTTPNPGTISGKVYHDFDKDRINDAGEPGVSGFTVKLYKNSLWWNSAVQSTTTDANGNYSFPNLENGTYAIELIKKDQWKQLSGDFQGVVVSNNAISNRNFAVFSKQGTSTPPQSGDGSISGKVFKDDDKDRFLDSGESGIQGVTIKLYKNAGWWGKHGKNNPIATVVTDAQGNYSFGNLADGTYSVEQIKKEGWKQISDDFWSLSIQNGTDFTDKNFANIEKNDNGKGKNKDKQSKGDNGLHLGWYKFDWKWNR
jgi:hypothetical protein